MDNENVVFCKMEYYLVIKNNRNNKQNKNPCSV